MTTTNDNNERQMTTTNDDKERMTTTTNNEQQRSGSAAVALAVAAAAAGDGRYHGVRGGGNGGFTRQSNYRAWDGGRWSIWLLAAGWKKSHEIKRMVSIE